MRKNFCNLQEANSIKNSELEALKCSIFYYIKNNFSPSCSCEDFDEYNFYVNNQIWLFRYVRGIKCWLFFIDDEIIINKYDKLDEFYINGRGSCEKWKTYFIDKQFIKKYL